MNITEVFLLAVLLLALCAVSSPCFTVHAAVRRLCKNVMFLS